MSNKAAGARFELRIKKYLESIGYTVERARPTLKWIAPGKCISGPNDLFGCCDIIALRRDKPFTLFIQATRGDAGPRLKKLEAIAWNLAIHNVQLWQPVAAVMSGVRVRAINSALGTPPAYGWAEHFFRIKDGTPTAPAGLL